MKSAEIINLIETNRASILEALKEADRTAYKHPQCRYDVALFSDGHTEERERLAGDNWWYRNDPAVGEIAGFCYEHFDVLGDSYPSYKELISDLVSECNETERAEYEAYLAAYQQKERERYEDEDEYIPEEYDIIQWFKDNSPAYDRIRDIVIEELIGQADSNGTYDELIDQYEKAMADIERHEEN